jgi:hypothetical protein
MMGTTSVYYPIFLTRHIFITSVNGFLKLKPRLKYEYLEMLCMSTSTLTNEFKDLVSIPKLLCKSRCVGNHTRYSSSHEILIFLFENF